MKGDQLTEVKDWRRMYEEEVYWWSNFTGQQLRYAADSARWNHKTMSLMFKIIKSQQSEINFLRERLNKLVRNKQNKTEKEGEK